MTGHPNRHSPHKPQHGGKQTHGRHSKSQDVSRMPDIDELHDLEDQPAHSNRQQQQQQHKKDR